MSDDRVDRFIDEGAAEYNRPPAHVPRDEMWARLQRHRARPRPDVTVTPFRRRTQWIAVVAAIAAALVVGILVGRFWSVPEPETTAENNPNPPSSGGIERAPEAPAPTPVPELVPEEKLFAERVRGPGERVPRSAAPVERDADVEDRSDISYEVATVNHLAQMEALLTAFRAQSGGQVDGQLSTWARDLLSTTRLLLDSPAAEEAKNRRLLEDLELVLVQIVNLAPDAGSGDRGSIERTLENGQVMTRLRTAVPAGGLPRGI